MKTFLFDIFPKIKSIKQINKESKGGIKKINYQFLLDNH